MAFILPLIFATRSDQPEFLVRNVGRVTEELVAEADNTKSDNDTMSAIPRPTEEIAQHLRPLYIRADFEGRLISRVIINNKVVVNILTTATMRNIGKCESDLIPVDLVITNFTGGQTQLKGLIPIDISVGQKVSLTAFFMDTQFTYNAFLRRDWIHANHCIPSSLH